MRLEDISVNDSLRGLQVQSIDQPCPMNTDPAPDRLAAMRMRLMEIKTSMDSIDLPGSEPSEPEVPPVRRQRTFTIEKKGKDELDQEKTAGRPTIAAQAPKSRSNANTCSRVKKANIKRLDYYKPRAAVTAPRLIDTNRVHTKTSFKISKNAIKKSLLESLETSTIDNNNNTIKENALTKPAALRASRIPVKIASYVQKKPLGIEARMGKLQLPAIPMSSSKIPVSPKFKSSLMSAKTPQ